MTCQPSKISVSAALLLGLPVIAPAFTFSDISFWTGQGTNQAALVIDWHDSKLPNALAWGFRWNHDATGRDLIEGVLTSDPRLALVEHPGFPGVSVYGLGYDLDGDRQVIHPGSPGLETETGESLDMDDLYREGWFTGFWSLWAGVMEPHDGGSWVYTPLGFADLALTNNAWIGWVFDDDFSVTLGGLDDRPRLAVAAESPYAVEVVSYIEGTAVGLDPITFEAFDSPEAALGRPTVETTGDGLFIPVSEPVPLVPVSPAFRATELVTVGIGGSLTLRFDHKVLDDPENPCGIDFMVYGNAFSTLPGGVVWTNGCPASAIVSANFVVEPSMVSVSQDGIEWKAFSDGPFADDFAPTLGRIFAPDSPAQIPGLPENGWWGKPTDPTRPLDPALTGALAAGETVAEVSRWFGASAGGTGFDLAELSFPLDLETGLKWIQYVRVSASGASTPEVDAVADAAPLLPYENWLADQFDFRERSDPATIAAAADPDSDRRANLFEYLATRDPRVADKGSAFFSVFPTTTNVDFTVVRYTERTGAWDSRGRVTVSSDGSNWTDVGIIQRQVMEPLSNGLTRVTTLVSNQSERLLWYRIESVSPLP